MPPGLSIVLCGASPSLNDLASVFRERGHRLLRRPSVRALAGSVNLDEQDLLLVGFPEDEAPATEILEQVSGLADRCKVVVVGPEELEGWCRSRRAEFLPAGLGAEGIASAAEAFIDNLWYAWGGDVGIKHRGPTVPGRTALAIPPDTRSKIRSFAVEARRFSSLDELLTWGMEQIADIFQCDSVSIYTFDPSRKDLLLRAAIGPEVDKRVGLRQQNGEGLAGWVSEVGEPLLVHDVRKVKGRHYRESVRYSEYACILAPLRREELISGVIAVTMKRDGNSFAAADLGALATLAYDLSGAMVPLIMVEELNTVNQELVEILQASSKEVRRYESDLEAYRMLNESIVESVPLGLMVYDQNLEVTFCNTAARELFGEEACASCVRLAVSGLEIDESVWRHKLSRVIQEGQNVLLRRLRYRGNGKDRLLDAMCSPLKSISGETVGGILTVKDVTEEVNITERLVTSERLALLGRLASEVAHQLNNPLDGILRFIRLAMRKMSEQDPSLKYLQSSEKGLLRMGRIITALLKYPRDGAMQTEYSHLHEIVAEAIRLYDHRARTSDVDIRVDVPTDIPVQHPGQLMEVLANLIKNSLDAMPEGGELSIRGNSLGDMVEITVADTGPGIPEDIREKVFHPFFSTKGEGQGCGLGLSICRDILERHGGEISLVPSDRGAVFLLRAPLDERFGQ